MAFIGSLIGLAGLAVTLPVQFWNGHGSEWPIRARAPIDTGLHGVVPALAVAPLWWTEGGACFTIMAAAFLSGFLLDLDHVIAFRSFSLEVCSSQEKRPFAHSLPWILLLAGTIGLLTGSALLGAVSLFALATHLLFDATDASGIVILWPCGRVVGNVPYGLYAAFLVISVAGWARIAPHV